MALTKIGKEGITGISNASDATFLTATSGEGVTLAGTLAVTGIHTVGTNAVATSDGGAVTTNIVQGLLKSWGNLDGTGTIAIRDSINVASAVDVSTGSYDFNYSNNMNNDAYSVSETVAETSGFEGHLNRYPAVDGVSTSKVRFGCTFNSTNQDVDELYVQIAGDLA
jgi:hypothetical protein